MPVQDWASAALAKMENGRAMEVVAELERAYEASGKDEASRNDTLRKEAAYFERNKDGCRSASVRRHRAEKAVAPVRLSGGAMDVRCLARRPRIRSSARDTNGFHWPFSSMQRSWMTA